MSAGFDVVLRGGVNAAREARQAIAAHSAALPPSVQDDLSLLVTELVTNAVLHGGAAGDRPVEMEFLQVGSKIRVEVLDSGRDFEPPARTRNGDSDGGWGLFLVDRIAERWGVCPAPAGTCVWFEVGAGATP